MGGDVRILICGETNEPCLAGRLGDVWRWLRLVDGLPVMDAVVEERDTSPRALAELGGAYGPPAGIILQQLAWLQAYPVGAVVELCEETGEQSVPPQHDLTRSWLRDHPINRSWVAEQREAGLTPLLLRRDDLWSLVAFPLGDEALPAHLLLDLVRTFPDCESVSGVEVLS